MGGERGEEIVVHRGVGVLLRIEHPDEDVDESHHPLHDLAVGGTGGVEVRKIQQDQAGAVVGEPGYRPGVVPVADVQPVQQLIAALGAPDSSEGLGGRRPPGGRRRDFLAADGVEKGRFAAAGGAEESDDGVVPREGAPGTGPVQHLQHAVQDIVRKCAGGQFAGLVQGLKPAVQAGGLGRGTMAAHAEAASRLSAAAWPASTAGATPPEVSSRARKRCCSSWSRLWHRV